MILIWSKNNHEFTTEYVMDWIENLGGRVFRLNGEDLDGVEPYSISLNNEEGKFVFNFQEQTITNTDINIIWFRRERFSKGLSKYDFEYLGSLGDKELEFEMKNHLMSELMALSHTIYSLFENSEWLDYPSNTRVNKLEVLSKAKKMGLDIPDTCLTNKLEGIKNFMSKYPKAITKCISEGAVFYQDAVPYSLSTYEIEENYDEPAGDTFFPSLIQENLDKEYEIRVFYLDGTCYSMAIFSQSNPKTKVDFRNYDAANPNRNVPYQLPATIAERINNLMESIHLKTGSIDLVKTKDGRYVFLEVNPVGQFGMVSRPCNYYLEKKVASYLIKKDKPHRS